MTTTKIEIIDSLLITEPPLVLHIIYTTNMIIIFTWTMQFYCLVKVIPFVITWSIHTLKETGLSEVIRQIIEEEILEFLSASTFKV